MAQLEVYYAPAERIDPERGIALLPEDESHHLLRVRRGRRGDALVVIDGGGTAWDATLADADGREARVELGERHERWREPAAFVHLGLGTLKGDAFLEAVNGAVQAGVSEVTPLDCRHSVAGWRPKRHERARMTARTAAKQCGRGLVPPLRNVQRVREWGIQCAEYDVKLVLDPEGDPVPPLRAGQSAAIAVGPEGGFHPDELDRLRDAGFVPASLGRRRLRSETAAILAVGALVLPVEM